ncbi:hypothetical protein [Sphingomonas oligoaromativorans]|uniref:hypothetical protein n=1 Tax=Sphingomonas oligoaromativorans TaxID=575322 RepID=UPI0014211016|nr:hypothetical protein [Sphingomonas oligoaromativorans]NIJ34349.1 hypothetical protein [Sphingomonas oligoaromativorans]
MSKVYRIIGLTFGCLIALVLATALAWCLYPEQVSFAGAGAVDPVGAHKREAERHCSPAQIKRLSGPAGQAERERCERAADEYQQDRDTHIQARRSADAADAQAIYAFDQARIAAIGTGLGLITMLAAIGAAVYAGRAAYEAKRSADISREAFLEQDRPWVIVETVSTNVARWRHGLDSFRWTFKVGNYGESLAIIDRIEAGVCFSDVLPVPAPVRTGGLIEGLKERLVRQELSLKDCHIGPTVLRLGDGGVVIEEQSGPMMKRDDVPEDKRATRDILFRCTSPAAPTDFGFWLIGKVEYRDARNRKLETGFCHRLLFRDGYKITEQGGEAYNYRK